MKAAPLVSVIIPVFNAEDFIKETLLSVVNQSYQNWECICIDDGSTDNTLSVAREVAVTDKRISVVVRPKVLPKGGNTCRNYGFKLSRGEFVQWFDSDDLMDSAMLDKKVKALQDINNLNYVICHQIYFEDHINNIIPLEQKLRTDNIFIDYLKYKTKFLTSGPFFRRSFIEGKPLFDESLKRHQEFEYYFRLLLDDPRYAVIDDILIYKRKHPQQLGTLANNSTKRKEFALLAYIKTFNSYRDSEIKYEAIHIFFIKRFRSFILYFIKRGKFAVAIKSFTYYVRALIAN